MLAVRDITISYFPISKIFSNNGNAYQDKQPPIKLQVNDATINPHQMSHT